MTSKTAPLTAAHPAVMGQAHTELNWVMLAQVGLMALNISIGLLVARHYPLAAYGQLSYFINIFGSLRLIAALGLTSQVVLTLAQARGQTTPLAQQFYPLYFIRLATVGVATAVVLGFSVVRQDGLLALAALAAALALLNDFSVGALQGLGQIKLVMRVLAVQPVLYAVGAALALATHSPIERVYQAFAFSFGPALGLASVWVVRQVGTPQRLDTHWRTLLYSLRYAGSMYLQAILGTAFTSYATLYFGATSRFTETALITIPLNLAFTLGQLVQTPMHTVYFPRLSQLYAANAEAAARQWLALFYNWVSAGATLVAVGACLYPQVILHLLYGTRYLAAAPLLATLAPVALLYTLQMVLTITLVAQRRWRAALGAPGLATTLLVGLITLTANQPLGLWWVAAAHTLAAGLGLGWQLAQMQAAPQQLLLQTGKHVLVAAGLLGLARCLVADAPEQTGLVILVGGGGAALYALWVWHAMYWRTLRATI